MMNTDCKLFQIEIHKQWKMVYMTLISFYFKMCEFDRLSIEIKLSEYVIRSVTF